MLQLYLNQLARRHLQGALKLTYNNQIKSDSINNYLNIPTDEIYTIADILQIFTFAYNVGHFHRTFVSSRATVIHAKQCPLFFNKLLDSLPVRFHSSAQKIIDSQDYHRLHLLNSVILLNSCDTSNQEIKVAEDLLFCYLNQDLLTHHSKLHYIFNLFEKIRIISYVAYDLQVCNTPLTIDLCDKDSLLLLLSEMLIEYNDNSSIIQLFNSISKMLHDTLYNSSTNAICYYDISNRMVAALKTLNYNKISYLEDIILNNESILNCEYSYSRAFKQKQILKLTFSNEHRTSALIFFEKIKSTSGVKCGYYDRTNGSITVLITLRNDCKHTTSVAFRILKKTIPFLQSLQLRSSDARYLLTTKFFLYYLFDEKNIRIKPTIHSELCLFCTRGKNRRIAKVTNLIKNANNNAPVSMDEIHEASFLLSHLLDDNRNDTTITIPASILVSNNSNLKICEFDGLIIHPNRTDSQIIFLEAKNTSEAAKSGKSLGNKLRKLNLEYQRSDITISNHNAHLYFSIK